MSQFFTDGAAMKTAVDRYIECLNNADLDGIVALYADNATVEDPVGHPAVEGIDAIREFYKVATSAKLSVKLTGAVRVAANEVAFPFEVANLSGKDPLVISIIDTFRFNEQGLVASMRAFWGMDNCRGDLSLFGLSAD